MSVIESLIAAIAANDTAQLLSLLTQKPPIEMPSPAPESKGALTLGLFSGSAQSSSVPSAALHLAAAAGASTKCLELILQHSADINSTNPQGRTALHLSSFHGKSDAVDYLLKVKDIDIDKITSAGCTAAYFAAYKGHHKILRSLLAAGSDPNAVTHAGSTCLIVSALNGHLDSVNLLLDKAADPNIQNATGATAMHTAASRGHAEILKALMARKGNPDIKDAQGRTANDILAARSARSTAGLIMPTAAGYGCGNRVARASVTLSLTEGGARGRQQQQPENPGAWTDTPDRCTPPQAEGYDEKENMSGAANTTASASGSGVRANGNAEKPRRSKLQDCDGGDPRASPTGSTLSG